MLLSFIQPVEVYPGSGVYISKSVVRFARSAETFSKMATRLLRELFTEEELATCSVMGCPRRGVTKASLDQSKVSAIIGK